MYRQLPNSLTMLRLLLAAIFFIVLNQYRYPGAEDGGSDAFLWISLVLFIFAAATDWLDGYLARRWQVESQFGRIMDPFCDKVLVIGAFVYLAGPRFVIPSKAAEGALFNMATGIYPWMVTIILARELLVTAIRAEMEGGGGKFGANVFGKAKMILQSVTIPLVMVIVWYDPVAHVWAGWVRDVLVYATVLVTIFSAAPYLVTAVRAKRNVRRDKPPEPADRVMSG